MELRVALIVSILIHFTIAGKCSLYLLYRSIIYIHYNKQLVNYFIKFGTALT